LFVISVHNYQLLLRSREARHLRLLVSIQVFSAPICFTAPISLTHESSAPDDFNRRRYRSD
jgi:hypothetical protein